MARATPEERWAAADRIATSPRDPVRRKAGRRALAWSIPVVVIGGVATTVVANFLIPTGETAPAGASGDSGFSVAFKVWLVVAVAGFFIALAGAAWALASGHAVTTWNRVDSPLTQRQQRYARRAIREGREPEPEHERVLLALAHQDRRTTPALIPIHAGTLLTAIGLSAALGDLTVDLLLGSCAIALTALATYQLAVTYPAAGRYIRQHS